MRKWMFGVLALAGSALVAVPGAMAQAIEMEEPDAASAMTEPDYDFYSPPEGTQLYGYRPLARVTPPGVAPAPQVVTRPGVAYFSPPGAAFFSPPVAAPVEEEVQVGPGPGQCGTFFYWSEAAGRCVDARLR